MTQPTRLTPSQRAILRVYVWATHRLYNELAPVYDPVSALVSGGRWDEWRRLALGYVAGRDVLEVGFGTGELLIAMRGRGLDIVGLELSPAMHRVAARKLARRRVSVPRVRASTAALPFGRGAFDTVVSTFPADYILQPATLAEIARVLRPAGRLVIAGLTVDLRRSWTRPLSWLPSSTAALWEYVSRVAGQAGLATSVLWHEEPSARVPIVVCEKEPA